jgi:hypothetical protein
MKNLQRTTILTTLFCLAISIGGCSNKDNQDISSVEHTETADKNKQDSSYWMNRLVDMSALAPFVSDAGWQSYYSRDFQVALSNFSGEALARHHLERAALYRQGLLMHARSNKNLYTQYKNAEDPVQSQYFLAESFIFLGEYEEASKIFSQIAAEPKFDDNIAQWKAWLATDKKKSPELTGFFFSSEGASANQAPQWNPATYAFPLPSGSFYEPSEGTSLWLLAKWHQDQAYDLMKDIKERDELIAQWLAPWRLPFENSFTSKPSNKTLSVSDNWLLFGFYLTPEDLAFSSALQQEPLVALQKWQSKSTLAQKIQSCVKEKLLDTECLIDAAAELEEKVRAQNKEATKSLPVEELNVELLYEIFPSFARYSLIRMGALFALSNNQNRESGMLQLMVREASGPVRDPLFLTFFSAWDAGNNATLRAQDLIHELSSEFSPLQTARVPLDFLHIRLGRNAVPSGASH